MTDFYSQNRCVCSTRSHGPLLCAFCLSFHFNECLKTIYIFAISIRHTQILKLPTLAMISKICIMLLFTDLFPARYRIGRPRRTEAWRLGCTSLLSH